MSKEDYEEEAAYISSNDNKHDEDVKDFKRIKSIIESDDQGKIEELRMYEKLNYIIVQAMLTHTPQLGAEFYANFIAPRLLASGFVSDVVEEWRNDFQKIDFVNELMQHKEIRNTHDMYYKLTTIAATVKNKNADKGLCKEILESNLYNFKRELFSGNKNDDYTLSSIIYSMQGNDYGRLYAIFDKWKDKRKDKIIQALRPYYKEFDYEKYKGMDVIDVPPKDLYDIEIKSVIGLLASTVKDNMMINSMPDFIDNNPNFHIRSVINNKIGNSNQEELYYINKYVGSKDRLLQLVLELKRCKPDKMKLEIINSLPNLEKEEYKDIALVLASTLEKKKSYDLLPDEIKDDYKYKMIEILNKEMNNSKVNVDHYASSKVIRDIITQNLDSTSADNFKEWLDDNAKLRVLNKILDLNKEMPKEMDEFVGEFATDMIQSISDEEIKAKVPVKSDNTAYTKYFDFKEKFERLEEELAKPNENNREYKIGIEPRLRFGIEIESEGPASLYLLNEGKIRTEGNKVTPKVWKTETDQTLKSGVEVVSPVLSDRPRDVRGLELVNNALRDMGQDVSERCGAHVHFGADYLTSKYSYINFVEIYTNCEPILYLIANKPGELPRDTLKDMMNVIGPRIDIAIQDKKIKEKDLDSCFSFVKKIKTVQATRNVGLNFYNVGSKSKNTFEFRTANGIVDGKDKKTGESEKNWENIIRLDGKLLEVSERIGRAEERYYEEDKGLAEAEIELIDKENSLKDNKKTWKEKSEILFDLLFADDEKTKDIYRERFDVNYKLYKETPEKKNPLKTIKFKTVDFKKLLNIKRTILKNRNIDLIKTEKGIMEDQIEMEKEIANKLERRDDK